jgi:Peptidase family C25/Propeptide_C25/HYDIN/CFA65/VesB-like, Ig-like domain/FlgD Ig-like domain
MKKKILITVFIVVSLNCFSIWNEIPHNADKPLFDHTSYRKESTTINFSLNGYEKESITVEGIEYQKIFVPNEGDFVEVGKPDLPCFTRLIAIPNTGTPRLEILNFEEEIISNVIVYPRQELQSESQPNRHEFEIDENYYAYGSLFPVTMCDLGEPAIMRDLRIVSVSINPFQYDPVTRELKIFTNVDVIIRTEGGSGQNVLRDDYKISRAFEPIYKSTVINYESTSSREVIYQNPSYLFIHTNDNSVEDALGYLADWKHQKGFEVSIHSVNSGTSFNTIKSYIQTAYDTWENPPEFVCLLGDASGPYNIPTDYTGGGEGDQGYTRLDGNDILADVLIGRLSIETITQLQTIIYKILNYEMQPYMGQTNWYEKVLLVGDPGSSGTSTIDTKQHIKQIMTVYNPDYTFYEVYGGSFSSNMSSYTNSGVSYFNYRGYMNMSGFGNSQINALNNGFMLPVVTIPTCATGTFASQTARSEEFLRAGSPGSPKGAIACFGTATTATHTCFNNIVDTGTYYGLFVDNIFNMGGALNRGKIALYNNYNQNQPGYVQNFSYWNNLMGDPGMEVWTGIPQALDVVYETQVAIGTNNLVVNVQNQSGQPIENAWVTALQGDDDIFVTGYTDAFGEVILEIDAQIAGNANLTVTKHDYIPHLGSFDVGLVPRFVNIFDFDIDDDNQGGSTGNNDGSINPGEVIEFAVSLKNSGTSLVNGVTATLSCDNDFITITDNLESYGNIVPGNTVSSSDDFDFSVDADALGGTDILLQLTIEDNLGNVWLDFITIQLTGANLYATDFNFPGQPNGILEPGATNDLVITLQNNGAVATTNVYGIISTQNVLININDANGYFGNITAGGTATNATNSFNISASNQIIPGSQINLELQLYNATGYDNTIIVAVEIGNVDPTDPLGPDAYGYYCFDSSDATYSSAPVYDWIEINSLGTSLPLNDNGQTGDVTDISNLPFIFQFYGEIYNSISVCSNGWITPGHTDNTSFMNWHIPGPQGPIPMIAAFWDDLETGNVYYYYDSNDHVFIIEWDDMENQHVAVEETFQIIIYDSAFYPTATGDNEIKIQYKEFNNVDAGSYPANHGQYCTIGIEDHTSTRGLEYTYNNQYPNAATVLQDQTAIKFTTNGGGTQEPPEMVLGQTSFDFIVQPGGSDNQVLEISNNGEANLVYSFSKNYEVNLERMNRNNGGPDDYGYYWYDSNETNGPLYSWRDISSIGSEVTFTNNDIGTGLMPIGFDFNFYGEDYSQFRINPNGWIGFGADNTEWTNISIPDLNAPLSAIIPFWDDLNPIEGGNVYYYSTSDSLIVWFDDVYHYGGINNGQYDFEMIIYNSGEMLFQYREVTGDIDSATIGIQNAVGDDGLQICYNTAYVQNELAIKIIKTDDWLDVDPSSGFIAQGQTEQITLTVDTEDMENGEYNCDLILNSNDPNATLVNIPVNMLISGSFPIIDLSANNVNFGSLAVGEENTTVLTVYNIGNEVLQVSDINFTQNVYSIDITNFSVNPGGSEEIQITFSPLAVTSYNAVMTISSNDPGNPTVEVSLTGEGILPLPSSPSDPIPNNGGSNISCNTDIDWTNGTNTSSIDLYFGSNNPPTTLVLDDVSAVETFDPGVLNYETTYYWQIVCRNGSGSISGDVWNFVTIEAPEILVDPMNISFGNITIGNTSTEQFTIANNGGSTLIGSITTPAGYSVSQAQDDNNRSRKGINAKLSGASQNEDNRNTLSFSIQNGEDQVFDLIFEPVNQANYDGDVVISSNDPTNPSVNISVSGDGIPPLPSSPSDPLPDNGASDVIISTDINWTNGSDTSTIDLYFGTNNPPSTLIFDDISAVEMYDPDDLDYETTYYWQVVCRNVSGSAYGDVWSFTTTETPEILIDPLSIDFGNIIVGNITSEPFTITNNGTSTAVGDITTPTGYSVAEINDYETGRNGNNRNTISFSLLSGEFQEYDLQFEPTSYTNYDGEVTITSNNPNNPTTIITLTGDGVPEIPSSPTDPLPNNGATDVIISTDIDWINGTNTSSIDLYFGTNNPPTTLVLDDVSAVETFDPGILNYETTYYWQVVCTNVSGSISGDVWNFTTLSAPEILVAPISIAFGNIIIGNTSTEQFTVSNSGGDVLTGDITTPDGYSVAEAVDSRTSRTGNSRNTLAFYILIDETQTFNLLFEPSNYTNYDGDVIITSNDPASPSVNIELTGDGIPEIPSLPTDPLPNNGANDVIISTDIDWINGTNTSSIDLYFGTNNPPTTLVLDDVPAVETFDLDELDCETIYYWQVVCRNVTGSTDGEVWNFTTVDAPEILVAPMIIAFGNIIIGNTSTEQFTISNNGGAVLVGDITTPDGYSISEAMDSRTSRTGNSRNTLAFSILIGETQTFNLLFEPSNYTNYDGDVIITSNDPASPSVNIELTGDGIPEIPSLPTDPLPNNGATDVIISTDINWTNGTNTSSIDLYFGTDNPPTILVLDDVAAVETYDLGNLDYETTYYWQVVCRNVTGSTDGDVWDFTTTNDVWANNTIIYQTDLKQNFPNPFNPSTTVRFALKEPGITRIDIYNIKGKVVKHLVNDQYPAGNHNVIWNGNNDNGNPVSSGIYFYILRTSDFKLTRKMLLMK